MSASTPTNPRTIAFVGISDVIRRLVVHSQRLPNVYATHAPQSEAWASIIAERPDLLIIEIPHTHSVRQQAWLRNFLKNTRDRLQDKVFIAVLLSAPEQLFFGGDLLFADDETLAPAGFIDTYLVAPPAGIPNIPELSTQFENLLSALQHDRERLARGGAPLPPLATQGWVQSLADPRSRELWTLWLPRYARYTNENPLIVGATGTGKTRLAHAIHILSGRTGPFISMTPRDFSSSELIQAELFGAVAGAYTGAVDKWGLVKSAEGGSLFIDELQSIDKDLQGKLITFVENKSYRRVGAAETTNADVRFIFATNRPIAELVAHDTLRDDFAYRLERVQLELQPLRERRLDICAALAFALAKIRRQRPQANLIKGCTPAAYRLLCAQPWPGNLRQLENSVAQLCEIADITGSSLIDEVAVNKQFRSRLSATPATSPEILAQSALRLADRVIDEKIDTLSEGVTSLLREARSLALEVSAGDPVEAAKLIQDSEEVVRLFSIAAKR
jgi:transcriptional regulator with AAA-type ATPase domain